MPKPRTRARARHAHERARARKHTHTHARRSTGGVPTVGGFLSNLDSQQLLTWDNMSSPGSWNGTRVRSAAEDRTDLTHCTQCVHSAEGGGALHARIYCCTA